MGKVIEPHHDLRTVRILSVDHLKRGVNQRNHPFRQVVMATAKGVPNARMVILREVLDDPLGIFVYTDARSNKIEELKSNDSAAFLFWHPSARLQVKLKTSVAVHSGDKLALKHYNRLRGISRKSYNTLKAPGTSLEKEKAGNEEYKAEFGADDFCVLECLALSMEVLQLGSKGHIRALFEFENKISSFLVP